VRFRSAALVDTLPGSGAERRTLARGVAERALLDAHRHGVGAEELVEMIRDLAGGDGNQRSQEARP
jgi:hypothetical protein